MPSELRRQIGGDIVIDAGGGSAIYLQKGTCRYPQGNAADLIPDLRRTVQDAIASAWLSSAVLLG
jgi:hypothetical protein